MRQLLAVHRYLAELNALHSKLKLEKEHDDGFDVETFQIRTTFRDWPIPTHRAPQPDLLHAAMACLWGHQTASHVLDFFTASNGNHLSPPSTLDSQDVGISRIELIVLYVLLFRPIPTEFGYGPQKLNSINRLPSIPQSPRSYHHLL